MAAYYLGELFAASGIPIVGLILLIVGLRQRSRNRQPPTGNPMVPPGYAPPGPYPYGDRPPSPPQPPTYPPPYPGGYPTAPPRGSSGMALIIVGSVLLGFGMLGILGIVGQAGQKALRTGSSARSADVGQCISESAMQEEHIHTAAPQGLQ